MSQQYSTPTESWHCPRCGADMSVGSHCWNCDANDAPDIPADASDDAHRDGRQTGDET